MAQATFDKYHLFLPRWPLSTVTPAPFTPTSGRLPLTALSASPGLIHPVPYREVLPKELPLSLQTQLTQPGLILSS